MYLPHQLKYFNIFTSFTSIFKCIYLISFNISIYLPHLLQYFTCQTTPQVLASPKVTVWHLRSGKIWNMRRADKIRRIIQGFEKKHCWRKWTQALSVLTLYFNSIGNLFWQSFPFHYQPTFQLFLELILKKRTGHCTVDSCCVDSLHNLLQLWQFLPSDDNFAFWN